MPGKRGMTGPGMGGKREGAGRPRTRYIFRPGEMVAIGQYDAQGNMQRIDYCNAVADDGIIRLVRSDGGWYEIGGWPEPPAGGGNAPA